MESRNWRSSVVVTLSAIVLGLAIWQLAEVRLPELVAGPIQVWQTFVKDLRGGSLLINVGVSLRRVLLGFVCALVLAIVFGFILGWYQWIRVFVNPWIQFLRMIPPIAMIPLVVVYLGVGEAAKVFVIFLAAFLLMLITIYQGVRQVDLTLIRAARVLGTNDVGLFFRVILPASVPYIFTATRLGIAAAWTTLVASELIASSHGLGYMIEQASNYMDMPTVYLGISIIGVIGILMDRTILGLEKKLTSWQEKVQ